VSGATWTRYVALGDSITEGFCDPAPTKTGPAPGVQWLGWADRLAVILDGHARLGRTSFEFANLAVRGRRISHIVEEQIPRAIGLRADLVSVMVGGNDLMSPKADPDALASHLEDGIRRLRASGAHVLLANCFDPQFAFFLKPFRGRAAVFNADIWSIARANGASVLDVWGIREFQQTSMWAADRVHLSTLGHRLLAARAANALGIPYAEIAARSVPATDGHSTPPDPLPFRTWLRVYAIPWAGRRLRGVSAGDGLGAKLPVPCRVGAPQ
jgi:lysophospholipase L1-like esterase